MRIRMYFMQEEMLSGTENHRQKGFKLPRIELVASEKMPSGMDTQGRSKRIN